MTFDDILKKYWEVNNGGYEPTEGDRDTLTFQLASDLRHICGKNFAWLDQVIPCYDGFPLEEKRQKIRNALASKYEGMPTRLKAAIDALEREKRGMRFAAAAATGSDGGQDQTLLPPAMPKRLPRLVKLLTSKTPDEYKAAVAHAVFPPLGTHLCGVRFKYTDNVEHEATLMNCLMAGTGAGKGCIDEPISHIMADIKRRDEDNVHREAEWKKDCQKRGANKDKMTRPEGLVIQIIDADMTKPALVQRMDDAEGHFVYVKLNELDLFEQLKGQTGKQHFQLMCLAFDPGAEYGQTRVGMQSVTARPQCRFNWNACTTIIKGRRFFRNVLTDGPISRINFCTIPETEIGCEQPVYGNYDAEFDEALRPYIDNLVQARGLTDCQQATRLAKSLQQECAEFARLSQSEVYWNLSHRACVIAWLKACVLYVANGMKWEKTIDDFIRWSLNYDLWCKMQFFGQSIAKAMSGDDSRIGQRGPRNMLEMLPEVFTIEDARRVRRQQGKDAEGTTNMLSQWKHRGYVLQMTDDSFKKVIV
ncbi:MAG: HEAT repeat domain-containing protein [Prevotella sp.]|nr:HEAT repeat domain-containing protein [Prevotella sp.]